MGGAESPAAIAGSRLALEVQLSSGNPRRKDEPDDRLRTQLVFTYGTDAGPGRVCPTDELSARFRREVERGDRVAGAVRGRGCGMKRYLGACCREGRDAHRRSSCTDVMLVRALTFLLVAVLAVSLWVGFRWIHAEIGAGEYGAPAPVAAARPAPWPG